jgi:hypothetical protein
MPIKTLLLLEKARMTNAVHEDEWPIWRVGGKSPHYLEAFSGFPYRTWLLVRKAEETPTKGRGFSAITSAIVQSPGIVIIWPKTEK